MHGWSGCVDTELRFCISKFNEFLPATFDLNK